MARRRCIDTGPYAGQRPAECSSLGGIRCSVSLVGFCNSGRRRVTFMEDDAVPQLGALAVLQCVGTRFSIFIETLGAKCIGCEKTIIANVPTRRMAEA